MFDPPEPFGLVDPFPAGPGRAWEWIKAAVVRSWADVAEWEKLREIVKITEGLG
jgi:hypothetical protein